MKLAIIIMTGLISIYNIGSSVHCGQALGCMDGYWADFWIISYSDGYTRRAMLGWVMEKVFGDAISYLSLNAIALSVSIAIISWFTYRIIRYANNSRPAGLVLLILAAGPSFTVLLEVLGDPLQVCLLLFIVFLSTTYGESKEKGFLLSFGVSVLAILIHEASVFLIIPAVVYIYSMSRGNAPNGRFIVASESVALLIFLLMFSGQEGNESSLSLYTTNNSEYRAAINVLPAFDQLIVREVTNYFSSFDGVIYLIKKIIGTMLWPGLFVLSFSLATRRSEIIHIYFSLLLYSLPLYLIAHDWGRFSIYTLLLSVSICLSRRPDIEHGEFQRSNIGEKIHGYIMGYHIRYILLIAPLLYISNPVYRINGLSALNLEILMAYAIGLIVLMLDDAGGAQNRQQANDLL